MGEGSGERDGGRSCESECMLYYSNACVQPNTVQIEKNTVRAI